MKYFWFLLAACFVGIIFYNSLLPLRQSSQLSGWVTALTQLLAQHLDIRLTGDVEHHIRKLAHFCEFALLGLLLCHSFSALGVSNRTATGYILFLALFAAVLDEYIQSFFAGTCLQGDGCAAGFQRCVLRLAGIPHLAVVPKIIKHGRLQLGADRRWAAAFCLLRNLYR